MILRIHTTCCVPVHRYRHLPIINWRRLDRAFCSRTVESVYPSVLCCFSLLLVSIIDFCCLFVLVCVKVVCLPAATYYADFPPSNCPRTRMKITQTSPRTVDTR